jgi:hypothetical protein
MANDDTATDDRPEPKQGTCREADHPAKPPATPPSDPSSAPQETDVHGAPDTPV